MVIQLANRSVVQPLGILEDVNKLIFLSDFYVLDMEDEPSGEGFALILGRPFLMTARTKIDVHAGTLSMEFGNTFVKFNIFEALKHPTKDHSIFSIDAIDGLVEDYFRVGTGNANLVDFVDISDLFLVIIANNLNGEHEEKLLEVLRKHKKAISWTLRRLNLTLLDVVKKEVTKLLAAEIIYPISDSQLVSLVQVVPKNSEMMAMRNWQDEMLYADSQSTSGPGQDHLYMSIRNIRVYKDSVRALQCSEYFPKVHDQHLLDPLRGLHGGLHGQLITHFSVILRASNKTKANYSIPNKLNCHVTLGWSSEGLAVSSACSLQYLGRYETHILGEVLSNI
ncbi:hypothetical protein CR513_00517, partial [Mucuna pruriens]